MDFATFEKFANNRNSEEGVIARFYDRAIKSGELSADGLPKFKAVCFCEIRIKDNNSEVYDQPADNDKIKRFPREYALYQAGKKQITYGTPLEQFAFLDIAEIAGLKLRGIFTVESLAQLDEEKTTALGLQKEQALAQKFIERAKGNISLAEWQNKENIYINKIKELEYKIKVLDKRNQNNGLRKHYEKYA